MRPRDVRALVVGEHGTSEVFLWSSASVGGIPVLDLLGEDGQSVDKLRQETENDIRYANITIIEGTGASQYGIGAVSARLAEAVLQDDVCTTTDVRRVHVELELDGAMRSRSASRDRRPSATCTPACKS